MQKIKSTARREAWYSGEGSKNYNPFQRTSSRRRITDLEQLSEGSRSLDHLPSQGESARRNQHNADYPNPPRAGTEPINRSSQTGTTDWAPDVSHDFHSNDTTKAEESDLQHADTLQPGDVKSTTSQDNVRRRTGKPPQRETEGHLDDDEENDKPKGRFAKWNKSKLTPWGEFKAVVFGSWINILLLAIPVGFAVNYAHLNGIANFCVNFVAIIPLAAMLSFATEELARYTNETLGGLLNASFGNATELIVSIIALRQQKVLIVQTSLIGSMLSNLLLVLGMCFFFGGITRVKQHFNITVAQTASSMLALSIGSLVIPTAFVRFGSDTNMASADAGVAPISRGTSVILLLVYASYLVFQLKTHAKMYNEPSKKAAKRNPAKEMGGAAMGLANIGARAGTLASNMNMMDKLRADDDDDEEPTLSLIGALVTLTAATVLIAFCSEFMVNGITTLEKYISAEFIGLILLPIVGNAAEHATAVTVACKDKMDLAIGVAVGSSMQIALLILPLMVVIGWCGLGQPVDMTLDFDGFQVTVLFIAVLLVNYLIQDGESHWLEGVLLQATYIIIALTAYYYPVNGDVAG